MAMNNTQAESLEPLLAVLASRRLIDFDAYHPAMLRRRLQLRLRMLSLPDFSAYHAYLNEHPEEIDRLLEAMSITVSCFFRNRLTFALLRERIIPALISAAGDEGVRIWCAGCGQGEEAYSMAILTHDYCQQEGISKPVLILATDIDREALTWAQRGWYPSETLDEVSKRHFEQYFTASGNGYQLAAVVRGLVTFAHHDLTSGTLPPEGIFSDYQLILCRNVLIYFKPERSSVVQRQLAAHLKFGGWLVLGEAETIVPTLGNSLEEVMPGTHIFRKEGRND